MFACIIGCGLGKIGLSDFQAEGNKDISSVLFAALDGKNTDQVIWKLAKPLI